MPSTNKNPAGFAGNRPEAIDHVNPPKPVMPPVANAPIVIGKPVTPPVANVPAAPAANGPAAPAAK